MELPTPSALDAITRDRRLLRRARNRAAPGFESSAMLFREICNRMLERLTYIRHQPGTILDAGSATGYGTRKLAGIFPEARIIALDPALEMQRLPKRPPSSWNPFARRSESRQTAICGELDSAPLASQSVGMVWSNLVLFWYAPLRVIKEFKRILAPEGLLMLSTLGPDTLKELREAFMHVDSSAHVNQFMDMHDLGDALVQAGLSDPVVDMDMLTLRYDSLQSLLEDLRFTGSRNTDASHNRGLMGKSAWESLQRAYEPYRRDGKLMVTFEIIYALAWRPPDRPRAGLEGSQIIRFERHRRQHTE